MINTYYLVLWQCDAYICHDWFKTREAAQRCVDANPSKEENIEEIKGDLLDVSFSDDEYPEPCPDCGKPDNCECDGCEDCGLIERDCGCINGDVEPVWNMLQEF
jgi:hypothetical protein